MRVLITTSTFPIRQGDGTPRFVFDLCAALAEHCDVTVLAPDAPGARSQERMGAVEVRRFRYFLPRHAQRLAYGAGIGGNLRGSPLTGLQVPTFLLAEAAATRALVAERGIDVVNSHWLLPQGLATALAGIRRWGARHVVTLHGGDSYLLARLPFRGALARFVVERSDGLLAASSNVRDNLDAALGRPSGAVLQPMGVDVARFREPATAPAVPFAGGTLLFVGRLVEIKGVSILLQALRRVREHHPDVGLVVVGEGPLGGPLRREAADLGLADAVTFAGAQPHESIAGYLQHCRALVIPSLRMASGRAEGMPTVVAEALAAGAPVVATAAGGVPDVIREGGNGWLARPGDADDLASALLRALADGSAVRAEATRSADALDWSHVAAQYLEVFEAAATSQAPA